MNNLYSYVGVFKECVNNNNVYIYILYDFMLKII